MVSKLKKLTSVFSALLLISASALISGCQTAGVSSAPVTMEVLPSRWVNALDQERSSMSSPDQWVAQLGDPMLQGLVNEALANNLELKVSLARMESARQIARIGSSQLYPSLSLDFSGSIREINGGSFDAFTTDRYTLSLGTSWEADLWGRVRNNALSGKLEFRATEYDLIQAKHSIAAAVSAAWYNLIAAKQQLELAEATAESFQRTADLIQDRYESGIDSALDYRLAASNAETAKSSLAQQNEAYKRAQRSLQVLLGRYPDGSMTAAVRFPALGISPMVGISSELLNRRPDIRAADRRLASAEASVKGASRERFPKIMITGATGTETEAFEEVLDGNWDFWQVGASLNQPLFDGNRRDAAFRQSQALLDQARVFYQQAVLNAFFEVEQAIEADRYFRELVEASEAAAEQSEGAEDLAWEQYSSGLINIVTVLESQRLALNAKRTLISAKNSRIQNRIQLYLALGGDI
jgi:multidrug efflux system outer membrane protein